jgi:ribosomal protein S27AE
MDRNAFVDIRETAPRWPTPESECEARKKLIRKHGFAKIYLQQWENSPEQDQEKRTCGNCGQGTALTGHDEDDVYCGANLPALNRLAHWQRTVWKETDATDCPCWVGRDEG